MRMVVPSGGKRRYETDRGCEHRELDMEKSQREVCTIKDFSMIQPLSLRPSYGGSRGRRDAIQAVLDKNATASRQELGPQIHPIGDDTHRTIHALLTNQQKSLEREMVQRRRP